MMCAEGKGVFLPRFVTWDPDLDLWVKLRELQETRKGGFVPRAPESGNGLQSAESAGLSCFTHRRWYDGGTAIRGGGNDSCETTGEQGTALVVRKWGELLGPAASQGVAPGPGWADGGTGCTGAAEPSLCSRRHSSSALLLCLPLRRLAVEVAPVGVGQTFCCF